MAKSIREMEETMENADLMPLSHDELSFGDNWPGAQSRHQMIKHLDEHGIWEKAVSFELLAFEKKF
jgi:hypothetical protein